MNKAYSPGSGSSGLLIEREEREAHLDAIKKLVKEKVDSGAIIDSVRAMTKDLESQGLDSVKESDVRMVMREELGMRFRKIKTVSLHSNSVKNLVLR